MKPDLCTSVRPSKITEGTSLGCNGEVTVMPAVVNGESNEEENGERIEVKVDEAGDDEQEAEPMKKRPNPMLPSSEEIDDHRVAGHYPYRSWCRECVEGRAVGQHHVSAEESRKKIPTIAFDYFFLTSGGIQRRSEITDYPETEEGSQRLTEDRRAGKLVKVILMKCSSTKMIFGHVVPYKGTGEDMHAVKIIVDDVKWLGHVRMILKCDNEPAIVRLVVDALKESRIACEDVEQIGKEHPEPYDSAANGMIENAIRFTRAHLRTLKLSLERQIRREIPLDSPIMAWMVEYSCFITDARLRGDDGHTAWTRCRGRPFRQQLVGFGETVLYKLPAKGPQHDAAGNMAARWKIGVFLGFSKDTNGYLVNDAGETKSSRALMRRPEQMRWNPELIEGIVGTPWDWSTRGAGPLEVRF